MQQKICSRCKIEKDATSDNFNKSKNGFLGLASYCKPCRSAIRALHRDKNNAYSREYHRKNRDAITQKMRDKAKERYWQNPELARAKGLEWYQQNKEKLKPQRKAYRQKYKKRRNEVERLFFEKNPARHAEIKAYKAKWFKNDRNENPEKYRSKVRERRARKRNAEGSHTAKDIARIYELQKGTCWWCGLKNLKKYHVDHRIPLFRGGSNGPENLVISCAGCNLTKSAKMPWEMRQPRLL